MSSTDRPTPKRYHTKVLRDATGIDLVQIPTEGIAVVLAFDVDALETENQELRDRVSLQAEGIMRDGPLIAELRDRIAALEGALEYLMSTDLEPDDKRVVDEMLSGEQTTVCPKCGGGGGGHDGIPECYNCNGTGEVTTRPEPWTSEAWKEMEQLCRGQAEEIKRLTTKRDELLEQVERRKVANDLLDYEVKQLRPLKRRIHELEEGR